MRVPEGWEKCSLKEVIEHIKGFAFDSSMYAEKGVRIIRISDTSRNSIHAENPIFISQKFVNNLQKYMLSTGDIILSTVGSRPHLLDSMVGKAVKIPETASGSLLNQNLVKLISIGTKITNDYLYEIVKNNRFIFYISTLVRGNANQVSITLNDLFKFEFSLPSLPEQQKIAQILSTWDKAIATCEQLLFNNQQQKKALMQQLLTGKKRLLDEDGVRFCGECPEYLLEKIEKLGWAELGRGNVISKKDMEDIPGEYPIYSSSVKNNGLMGAYGDFMFEEELISWSVDGGGNFFYRPKHKFSITNVSGYMRLDTNKLDYQFIAAQLEFLHSKLKFDYQTKAHPSVIRKMYILAIPTLEEQKKISTVLSTADREIELIQTQLEALKQEKKALMQQLLTGKRRVVINH